MSYPTLEQYNEALQHPETSLTDAELRTGRVAQTGLGLPLALCGGFALTYTISANTRKYAVRCFHKQSNDLEKRYAAISNRIRQLASPYFVDFQFQASGIRIRGAGYPVVKMAWASGKTLGEFLESSHQNKAALEQLIAGFGALADFLHHNEMAHGDIQPGNVMVDDTGRKIQLIDYDGMFVADLKNLGSNEAGHRNFQHPNRRGWDSKLDRFSFIALNVALRALESEPTMWRKTGSDGDSILFRANDFADPQSSQIFGELVKNRSLCRDVQNLMTICQAKFEEVPSLSEFLAGNNIPTAMPAVLKQVEKRYISAFKVVSASDYSGCLRVVGDRVELIGKIREVKSGTTKRGKPYVFINFGPWQGSIVKISIWSEGLSVLASRPNNSWVGRWVSVVGLMEPPYVSRRYNYSHLSINVTLNNQMHVISDAEATFRLSSVALGTQRNADILQAIGKPRPNFQQAITQRASTPNQAILQSMRGSQASSGTTSKTTLTRASSGKGCLLFLTAILALSVEVLHQIIMRI